ncbi:hypothetical protein T484DRAFT_1757265, partial [Baffinella frigidus]
MYTTLHEPPFVARLSSMVLSSTSNDGEQHVGGGGSGHKMRSLQRTADAAQAKAKVLGADATRMMAEFKLAAEQADVVCAQATTDKGVCAMKTFKEFQAALAEARDLFILHRPMCDTHTSTETTNIGDTSPVVYMPDTHTKPSTDSTKSKSKPKSNNKNKSKSTTQTTDSSTRDAVGCKSKRPISDDNLDGSIALQNSKPKRVRHKRSTPAAGDETEKAVLKASRCKDTKAFNKSQTDLKIAKDFNAAVQKAAKTLYN